MTKDKATIEAAQAAQRAEVEGLLAHVSEYVVDVVTLAILKARQHEIAYNVEADGRGIASGIGHLENRLEQRGRDLVEVVERLSKR